MAKVMKTDVFTRNIAVYGADISDWPPEIQASARAFAKTQAGATLLAEEHLLDKIIAEACLEDQKIQNSQQIDVFTERLCAIPAMHAQVSPQKPSYFARVIAGLEHLVLPPDGFWSPTALISQTAVFALVLGLGIVTGLNGVARTVSVEEVDISDGWFSVAFEIEYSEELEG